MKKTILILLIIVALPLYSYNVYLLLRVGFEGGKKTEAIDKEVNGYSFEQLLYTATPVRFEVQGRDPFLLYKMKTKTPVKKKKVTKKKMVKKEVAVPLITLTGILWNSSNPVAMIKLPGGVSKLAKAGEQIGNGITVKRVHKKSIIITFEGKDFTITRK